MADITFGQNAEQQKAQAFDSSEPRKLHEKQHDFDLQELWGAKLNTPKEQEKEKGNSFADALPQLVVGNDKNAAAKAKPNVIDTQEDHTEHKNAVGIKQQHQGELLDDMKTIIPGAAKGDVKVSKDVGTKLTPDQPGDKNLPVVYSPDVARGQIGILTIKQADGNIRYTPFLGGDKDPNKTYKPGEVEINNAAAKELGIERDLQRGRSPKVEVIVLPKDPPAGGVQPRTPDALHDKVTDKIHEIAELVREKDAEEKKVLEATLVDPAKPDDQFGYRRTSRTPAELTQIAENYRKIAKDAMDATDPANVKAKIKEYADNAQKDVKKYTDEINDNTAAARKAKAEVATLEKQIADRTKKKQETESIKPKLETAKAQEESANRNVEVAKYNKSYAEYEVKLAKNEKEWGRQMQAKASAAAALSMNPDMEGGLTGRRIVVNSGHWEGDPKFPGFEYDKIAEWKLNSDSQRVYGEMLKMTGAAVKIINQIDMPKAERGMTGLASAIKAAKPEAAISIHHDAAENKDSPGMDGTLTLHCAPDTGKESLDLATAIHKAKINYGNLDDRYNARGVSIGIREQCGRGIQGHDVDAPFILDEQFSTHKNQWPKAIDPKWNAQEQFAKVVGVMEFLNKTPVFKSDPATGKEYQRKIWDQTNMDYVWKGRKVGGF